MKTPNVVVMGAGIGGLTAAALLLKAGHAVTVLESHIYPGGCAGTFYHQGYRFDVSATLAGGFAPGGPHARLAELLNLEWPIQPIDPAWVVHLPDQIVTQWADSAQWGDERRAAFSNAEKFWKTQEALASIAWEVAARPFPGQSTAGVTWGGLRVAATVSAQAHLSRFVRRWPETIFNQRLYAE